MVDYDHLKAVELRSLLKTHQLKSTGTRAMMIQRLRAHDFDEEERWLRSVPFRFLDLPSELRNMIYKMIARHPRACGRTVNPFISACKARRKLQQGNREEVTQPSLFGASAKIRSESIDLFYQIRNFEIDLGKELPALKLLQPWLSGIGEENCQRIRSLTLSIGPGHFLCDRLYYIFSYLLENLSQEATITCQAENRTPARRVWSLGVWCKRHYGFNFPLLWKEDGQKYQGFDSYRFSATQNCELQIMPGRSPVKAVEKFSLDDLYSISISSS